MRKSKRQVSYDDHTYKVRSDTIEIPDFTQMDRTSVLLWLCRHTYGRGYSKSHPLLGLGGVAITLNRS